MTIDINSPANKKTMDELFPVWQTVSKLDDRSVFDAVVENLIVYTKHGLDTGRRTDVTEAGHFVLVRASKVSGVYFFEVCITIHQELR